MTSPHTNPAPTVTKDTTMDTPTITLEPMQILTLTFLGKTLRPAWEYARGIELSLHTMNETGFPANSYGDVVRAFTEFVTATDDTVKAPITPPLHDTLEGFEDPAGAHWGGRP